MEKQEYFVSKKKAKKSIIIMSIILLGILSWYILLLSTGGSHWINHTIFGLLFGLFLFAMIMGIVKMNTKVPALVLSDEGVIEALGGSKDHVHAWETVEKVGRKKVFGRLYVLVFIKNPYQFIESQSGRLKKRMNQMYGQVGTPVAFPVEFLEGDSDVIFNQIKAKVREHRGVDAIEDETEA